jgi:hypothetical protein
MGYRRCILGEAVFRSASAALIAALSECDMCFSSMLTPSKIAAFVASTILGGYK